MYSQNKGHTKHKIICTIRKSPINVIYFNLIICQERTTKSNNLWIHKMSSCHSYHFQMNRSTNWIVTIKPPSPFKFFWHFFCFAKTIESNFWSNEKPYHTLIFITNNLIFMHSELYSLNTEWTHSFSLFRRTKIFWWLKIKIIIEIKRQFSQRFNTEKIRTNFFSKKKLDWNFFFNKNPLLYMCYCIILYSLNNNKRICKKNIN